MYDMYDNLYKEWLKLWPTCRCWCPPCQEGCGPILHLGSGVTLSPVRQCTPPKSNAYSLELACSIVRQSLTHFLGWCDVVHSRSICHLWSAWLHRLSHTGQICWYPQIYIHDLWLSWSAHELICAHMQRDAHWLRMAINFQLNCPEWMVTCGLFKSFKTAYSALLVAISSYLSFKTTFNSLLKRCSQKYQTFKLI